MHIAVFVIVNFKVKSAAQGNVFQAAGAIVDQVLLDEVSDEAKCIPNPETLRRKANRVRQKDRPADPVNLEFQVNVLTNRHIFLAIL